MRQVVLDTETTGLETEKGHRIIEVGGEDAETLRGVGDAQRALGQTAGAAETYGPRAVRFTSTSIPREPWTRGP